jgi:tetratricopeptide (TPR) repeat protein
VGECLYELQEYEDAIKAYEKCLSFGTAFNKARVRIIHILTSKLNQPGRAKRYQVAFNDQIEGTINIVSGLPRSGTSLMMQMLEAGGQDVFTDKERVADDSNTKGYYEHEAVKNLAKNSRFLIDAVDKTVKVISNLLIHLPSRYKYRIVFLNRDLMEVIRSQQKMLIRDGKKVKEDTLPLGLMQKYEDSLKKTKLWMKNQRNIEFIEVDYSELIDAPLEHAIKVHDFFSKDLKPEVMARIPDPKLYRERTNKKLEV